MAEYREGSGMSKPAEEHMNKKITKISEEIQVDCSVMDKRTRKLLIYLVDQEIKKLKGFPKAWVGSSMFDFQELRDKLASGDIATKKRKKVPKKEKAQDQVAMPSEGDEFGDDFDWSKLADEMGI